MALPMLLGFVHEVYLAIRPGDRADNAARHGGRHDRLRTGACVFTCQSCAHQAKRHQRPFGKSTTMGSRYADPIDHRVIAMRCPSQRWATVSSSHAGLRPFNAPGSRGACPPWLDSCADVAPGGVGPGHFRRSASALLASNLYASAYQAIIAEGRSPGREAGVHGFGFAEALFRSFELRHGRLAPGAQRWPRRSTCWRPKPASGPSHGVKYALVTRQAAEADPEFGHVYLPRPRSSCTFGWRNIRSTR